MAILTIPAHHHKIKAANGGEWFDFEGLVRDIYVAVLKPGDIVLDIGVNEGVHFGNMGSIVGNNGLVVGFEAILYLADIVTERATLGNFNFRLHNVAVLNYEGEANFNWVKGSTGLSSPADRGVAKEFGTEKIQVTVTTIDSLLSDINDPIKFCKSDIEGAEFHAMQKGLKIFRDRSPIVFEFDQETPAHFRYNVDDLMSMMKSREYEVYDFFGNRFMNGQELLSSAVWNYYAAPAEKLSRSEVKNIVSYSLRNRGIYLLGRDA